jgi:hypothetical protein
MDGGVPDWDLGLAVGRCEYGLLVDDAGGDGVGVRDFVSYELGFG